MKKMDTIIDGVRTKARFYQRICAEEFIARMYLSMMRRKKILLIDGKWSVFRTLH